MTRKGTIQTNKLLIHTPSKLSQAHMPKADQTQEPQDLGSVYIQGQETRSTYIQQACHVTLEHLY